MVERPHLGPDLTSDVKSSLEDTMMGMMSACGLRDRTFDTAERTNPPTSSLDSMVRLARISPENPPRRHLPSTPWIALGLASALGILLGFLSWLATRSGLPWWVPVFVGISGVTLGPFATQRLRKRSGRYAKGDLAPMFALEFIGWLALWFVLANLA